jgi:DsbC/DsbD-like thiol-disulfide interchange protein
MKAWHGNQDALEVLVFSASCLPMDVQFTLSGKQKQKQNKQTNNNNNKKAFSDKIPYPHSPR